jgi:hypothetical protein
MEDQGLCLHCGERFEPNRAWQKFCCESCRNAYHNLRHIYRPEQLSEEDLAKLVRRVLRAKYGPAPTPQDEGRRFRVRY